MLFCYNTVKTPPMHLAKKGQFVFDKDIKESQECSLRDVVTECVETLLAVMLRKARSDIRSQRTQRPLSPRRPSRTSDTSLQPDSRKTSTNDKRKVSRVHKGRLQFPTDIEEPDPLEDVTPYDFFMAASSGGIKTVRKYLDDGGDVNVKDSCRRTALHRACLYEQIAIVDLLLAHGASVNSVDKLSNTPLHWACRGSKIEVVQALMSHHAKVNKKDKLFNAPLHVATRVGFVECVDYLLECGAKINEKDCEGDLPIHDAVRLGRAKVVRSLILHGADMKAKNKNGKTAFDMMQAWYNNTKDAMTRAQAERLRKGTNVEKIAENEEERKVLEKAAERELKARESLSDFDQLFKLLESTGSQGGGSKQTFAGALAPVAETVKQVTPAVDHLSVDDLLDVSEKTEDSLPEAEIEDIGMKVYLNKCSVESGEQ